MRAIFASLLVVSYVGCTEVKVPGAWQLELVSRDWDGEARGRSTALFHALSGDGRVVSFTVVRNGSGTNPADLENVFLHSLESHSTRLVTLRTPDAAATADPGINWVALSYDGSRLLFSSASSFVPGLVNADSNTQFYSFASDAIEAVTVRNGALGNGTSEYGLALSDDGATAVFPSLARNLTNDEPPVGPVRLIISDANGLRLLVSSSGQLPDGTSFDPDVAADGRRFTFVSLAQNLHTAHNGLPPGCTVWAASPPVDDLRKIYFLDGRTGNPEIRLLSGSPDGSHLGSRNCAHAESFTPRISADGNFVVFLSEAVDLASDGTVGSTSTLNLYQYSVETSDTRLLASNAGPLGLDVSGDGRYVVFGASMESGMSQVFSIDTHRSMDDPSRLRLVSANSQGTPANEDCALPHISNDGRVITFASSATNLADGAGGAGDVFDIFASRLLPIE